MTDLRKLTEQYVAAFNARDIDGVTALFSDNFCLTDPSVTNLTPREASVDYIKKLFRDNPALGFHAKSILVDGNSTVIHFSLSLRNSSYDGIDLIEWQDGVMSNMTAYLTQKPERIFQDNP